MAVNLPQSYRALIESSDELIWSVDLNHRLRAFNSTFLRHAHAIYGVHTGVDPCAEELAPTEMVSAFSSFYTRAMADGAFRLEHSLLDGQILEMAFSPTLSEDNITGVSVFARDITERRAAENAFRQAEKKYRDIFEGAIEGIFQSSPNGEVWSLNVAMARMLGYKSPREFKAKVRTLAQDVWADPEERAKYLHLLEENGEFNGYECQCKCKDGKLIWVSLKVRRMLGRDGQLLYYHGFIEDISDRRLVAQALAERELLFRQFFEANGSMMLLIDPASGAIVDANPAAAAYYGYTRQQLTEMTISQINMLSPKEFFAEWRKAFDKEQNHFIFPHRLASGEMRDVEVYSSPVTVTGRHLLFSIVHDITERRQAQQALAEKESLYRQFFEGNGSVILLIDPSNETIFDANEAALAFYGYSREEMIGMSIVQINPRPAEAIQADLKLAVQRGRNHLFLLQRLSSGELRDVEVHSSPVSMGGRQLLFSIIQDITERNRTTLKLADSEAQEKVAAAQEATRSSNARLRAAFEINLDLSAISRMDSTYIEVNAEFLKVLGYEREEVIGKTAAELQILAQPDDVEKLAEKFSRDHMCRGLMLKFRKKSGEAFWGEMSASVADLDGVPHVFSSVRDLSATLAAEDEIYKLAFLDPLTSLPNRRLLLDELRQAQANAIRSGLKQTLLMIDLDNFKALNDSLGHSLGDLMLQEVAQRITSCLGKADTVARIGGDEFVVMLKDLSKIPEEVAAHAKMVADKILAAIDQPFLLARHECRATASVGVTVFGDPSDGTNEILQQVEIALYQAKAEGRNRISFFVPALQTAVNARMTLVDDIRRGIEEHQFQAYYQPQIMNGRLTGVESLIRWQHPTRGLVLPNDFIPLAEETGQIVAIGVWGLEDACKQLVAWAQRKDTSHLRIAVNISARHFSQPDFVDQVLQILERSGANATNLELELTEGVMVQDFEDIIAKMTKLKSHGIKFSLDDFGTGYSSLSYLKRLPLDHLKIDISFIREILTDHTSATIARAIISIGQAMDLPVIAEGVETEEQRGFLLGLGCHSFQGYLFSRALPVMDFEAFLVRFTKQAATTRS